MKSRKSPTNNVTRMLDKQHIPYTAYALPPKKLGAVETARLLGVPAEQVFKTIVVVRPAGGKPILAVIPGPNRVDLKALAKAVGEKKVKLATQREAEQLTGLQVGGISPLALLNRGFQVWLDERALEFDEIHLSGGQRGLNIRLRVQDVIDLCRAHVAPISRPDVEEDT